MSFTSFASPAFSTGHVMTQTDIQQITDNCRYLKGTDGAVLISDTLQATRLGLGVAPSASYMAYIKGDLPTRIEQGSSQINYLDLNNTANANNHWGIRVRDLAEGDFGIRDEVANAYRMYFNSAGSIGIGTTTPAGKLHVNGAGAIAGAGLTIGSVAAVSSLQTVFAAGAVARAMTAIVFDRDNGASTPLTVSLILGVPLSGNTTYTCTAPSGDVITIAVTAGGAVTAQRTSGTHGTHDIVVFLLTM